MILYNIIMSFAVAVVNVLHWILCRLLGADFVRTDRGGLITFHGPGQLVAYPIINLKAFRLGMKTYICQLQKTVIGTCLKMGVTAETSPEHTGVWVKDRKI